jgi:lipoprotein-anchoring transpeptidase ErfK/SrfK
MRQRSFIVVAIAITVLVVGAVGVYAYDKHREGVIAKGVTAGGVDLSGLHESAARAKLQRDLARPLSQPVFVQYHGKRYRLSPRRVHVRLDVDAMVRSALDASREGNLVSRSVRSLTGSSLNRTVPVALSYSRPALQRFATRVKKRLDRPARDASIGFVGGSVEKIDSRKGRIVNEARLERRIATDLVKPASNHVVSVPTVVTHPKVTTRELAQRYPRVITINRGAFRLTFYRHLKAVKTYTIAVGQQGLETPAGRYNIQDKQINPSWHVPNSPWAGDLAGRVIPPGPQDPIKARWMGIAGGAGIHGTDDIGSLGSAASHGCIRMSIPDVEELFDKVETGDPVFIA